MLAEGNGIHRIVSPPHVNINQPDIGLGALRKNGAVKKPKKEKQEAVSPMPCWSFLRGFLFCDFQFQIVLIIKTIGTAWHQGLGVLMRISNQIVVLTLHPLIL